MRSLLLLVLALASCQSPSQAERVPTSLSELEVGETVRLDYLHEGCFVNVVRQRVEIARNSDGWVFETWLPEEGSAEPVSLGSLWIRPEQLSTWDALVDDHRSRGPAASTARSVVELSWRRDGASLRSRRFERDMEPSADAALQWLPVDPLTTQLRETAAALDALEAREACGSR